MTTTTPTTDWRDLVQTELIQGAARQARPVNVRFNRRQRDALERAAKRRGISAAAYLRRAAVAFAAADLGLDWFDLNIDEPPISPHGTNVGRAALQAEGRGFGPWKIERLAQHG